MSTEPTHRRSKCSSCGALIVWASTSNGELMPINSQPDYSGNVVLQEQNGTLHAGVLGRLQVKGAYDRGEVLYRSHFTDCPDAKRHRRNR